MNTLGCSAAYAPDVNTTMRHKNCEALAGASQAWADAWIHVDTETGVDTLAFYYADAGGTRRGYGFSGSWNAWFHVVLNLKQWYRVGDVTATSCPQISVEFDSDSSIEDGFGVRIDDLTVSTSPPAFLSCGFTASPSTGTAPLTVTFSPTVSGGSASTTYLWSFGDAANTTSTAKNATFTYASAGEYTPRLRVSDAGVNAYAHGRVVATSGGSCSLACSASVGPSGRAGHPLLFQGGATPSGCSGATTWSWTFGDGQSSSQQSPQHAYAAAGTYQWTLHVSSSGTSCTKSGSVVIRPAGALTRRRAVRVPSRGESVLGRATIGSAGGTLTGGGLTLTIPAGAFSSGNALTLSRSSAGASDGQVGERFTLEGLPASFAKDLRLELQLPAGLSLSAGEKFYISFGAPAYLKGRPADSDEEIRQFHLVPSVAGTKLTVTVPVRWGTFAAAGAAGAVGPDDAHAPYAVDIMAEKLLVTETPHFYALVFESRAAQAKAVLDVLETHFGRLTGMGFSLACRNDSGGAFRKIQVVPKALGTGPEDPLGNHVSKSDPCGTGWFFNDYLEISTSYPVSDPRLQAAAGHELFHLVQDIYSPGGARANLWLKEASSVWYEIGHGVSCPDVQSKYLMFPWNGLFNSKQSAANSGASKVTDREAAHGYGASNFLWYFTAGNPDSEMVRVLWDLVRGGSTELAAFQTLTSASGIQNVWSDFARDYFFGRNAGTCGVNHQSFELVAVGDNKALPKSLKIGAYPLGARSWAVDLQKYGVTGISPGVIAATGMIANQSVYVWDVRAKSQLAELTADEPRYSIPDLNALKGSILILVLVDRNVPAGDATSQSSTNEVTLTVAQAASAYSIKVPQVTTCGDHNSRDWGTWGFFYAQWKGLGFESEEIETETESTGMVRLNETKVSGTLSADRKTVVTMTIEIHGKETYPGGASCPSAQCVYEVWKSVELANVTAAADWNAAFLHFEAKGAGARAKVTKFVNRVLSAGWRSDNFDCTYPIDESKADTVEVVLLIN